jgi:hypothetical protein
MAARRGRGAEPAESAGRVEGAGLLPLAAAAEAFRVPRSTLTRAARVGNLEARRLGNQWVTTAGAVRAWLREARHRPGPGPGQGVGRPRAPAPAVSDGGGAPGAGAPAAAPGPPDGRAAGGRGAGPDAGGR